MTESGRFRLFPDLSGLRVLVTGAGSGIGLATATLFARAGASVAANHLPGDRAGVERLEALAAQGLRLTCHAGDMASPGGAGAAVGSGVEALGGLDVLVNNAGTSGTREPIPFSDLGALDEEFWQLILSTNLVGPFRAARAAEAALRRAGGAIVNVASVAGLGGDGSSLAYAASKAGLINLTRNLAKGLAPDVRVNAVAPGLTRTPWIADWPEARTAGSLARTMLNRLVEPEDVAESIAFLALQRAITGQTLAVDCGRQF